MPIPQAEVARQRAAQARIAELVRDQLRSLFDSLPLNKPEDARNLLLAATPELVRQYGDMAATLAADAYDEWRALQNVPGRFRAKVFDSPYLDAVEPTVRRAAGALWTDNPIETLVGLSAAVDKYVLAAGRETIARNTDADPQARGWHRVARATGCRFCRMLADRRPDGRPGGVYSEAGVHFAAHGDCRCTAVPSWDANAKPVPVGTYEASKRTSGMSPAQKAAHNKRVREWMDANGYVDEPTTT